MIETTSGKLQGVATMMKEYFSTKDLPQVLVSVIVCVHTRVCMHANTPTPILCNQEPQILLFFAVESLSISDLILLINFSKPRFMSLFLKL